MICSVIGMIILKCKSTFGQFVELVLFMLTRWVMSWVRLDCCFGCNEVSFVSWLLCVLLFSCFFMNVWIWLLLLVFAYYALSSLSLYDHLVLCTHHQVTSIPQGVWQINQEQWVTSSVLLVMVHYLILFISFYLQTKFLLFLIFVHHK